MSSETVDAAQVRPNRHSGNSDPPCFSELLPAVIAASDRYTAPVQATSRRERRERERAGGTSGGCRPRGDASRVPAATAAGAPAGGPGRGLLPRSNRCARAPVVQVETVPSDHSGGAAHQAEPHGPRRLTGDPAASVAPSRADRVPSIPGVTVRRRIRRPFKRALLSKLMSVAPCWARPP